MRLFLFTLVLVSFEEHLDLQLFQSQLNFNADLTKNRTHRDSPGSLSYTRGIHLRSKRPCSYAQADELDIVQVIAAGCGKLNSKQGQVLEEDRQSDAPYISSPLRASRKDLSLMKIGLAQIDCRAGDLEFNCSKFAEYASRAKLAGCNVIIFPELSDTGYVPSIIANCAQPWPGPSLDAARSAAATNSINLICGISERTEHAIFNSLAIIDTSGLLRSKYRKTHLFSAAPVHENRVFSAGDELTLVDVGSLCWGLTICYDLRFPELYRKLTLRGAHVLLNCAAWPTSRALHWDCLTRARAIENQAFFVGVGRVGRDGELNMHGHSRVLTPRGEILCEGGGVREELLVAEIDVELIAEFRTAIPAISSRRPDLYGGNQGQGNQLDYFP